MAMQKSVVKLVIAWDDDKQSNDPILWDWRTILGLQDNEEVEVYVSDPPADLEIPQP